jgi:UDP-N-acetylglucosamine diphosphorylase/glucosamine-1-phosphate N-acetyltransferase
MKTRLFIFEDDDYEHFLPLSINRPVFTLLCGTMPLWKKWMKFFPDAEIGFFCRGEISAYLREQTSISCNSFNFENCDRAIFVNGRIIPDNKLVKSISESKSNRIFLTNGNLTALTLDAKSDVAATLTQMNYWGYGHFKSVLKSIDKTDIESEWLNYIWDFIAKNPSQIIADRNAFAEDYAQFDLSADKLNRNGCLLHNSQDILVSPDATIDGQTVLDAHNGVIIIDKNVHIDPHTRVVGPCYIGPDCHLVGGKIREGCSFGPCCRVGGEVEESIFLGYSNKYHEGFMGHAYLGEWVNLGALTTNSDLKNNYGNVRVNIGIGEQDTKLMKVGSFIGDHVKTGIGTLLNTGISIGFATNIFGGGLLMEKYIPPYVWGGNKGFFEYRLDKAIETAMAVMKRRDVEMTDRCKEIFKSAFESTAQNRQDFGIN